VIRSHLCQRQVVVRDFHNNVFPRIIGDQTSTGVRVVSAGAEGIQIDFNLNDQGRVVGYTDVLLSKFRFAGDPPKTGD
jgi:hypothetical protein